MERSLSELKEMRSARVLYRFPKAHMGSTRLKSRSAIRMEGTMSEMRAPCQYLITGFAAEAPPAQIGLDNRFAFCYRTMGKSEVIDEAHGPVIK